MKRYYPFSYKYDANDFLKSVDDYRRSYTNRVDDMRENEPNVYKACRNYEENNVSFLSDFYNLVVNIDQLGERAAEDFANRVEEYIFYMSAAVLFAEHFDIDDESETPAYKYNNVVDKYLSAVIRIEALYTGRKYEAQARSLIGAILFHYWQDLTRQTTREHNAE